LPANPLDRERQAFSDYDWGSPSLVWHFWPLVLAIVVVAVLALVYWVTRRRPPRDEDDEH
jgi:hypothetical protein